MTWKLTNSRNFYRHRRTVTVASDSEVVIARWQACRCYVATRPMTCKCQSRTGDVVFKLTGSRASSPLPSLRRGRILRSLSLSLPKLGLLAPGPPAACSVLPKSTGPGIIGRNASQCFISNLSLSLSCKLDSEVDKFKKFLPPSPHGNRCQRLGSCNSSLAGLSLLCCHTTYDLQVSVTDRRCRFQVDRITGIISAAVPTPRQNTSVTVTVIAQAGPVGPGPSGGLQCAPEVHRPRDNWQKCQPMLHLELEFKSELQT